MSSEETRNTPNHSWRVNALTFELLHDVQEVVIHLRLVAKLELYLIEVGQSVFYFEFLEIRIVGVSIGAAIGCRVCGSRGNGGHVIHLKSRNAIICM